MLDLRALLKETIQVYSAQILGVLISFGISILVARTLGADGRGAYGWVMAIAFIGIQVGQLGTDTLNRRWGAENKSLGPVLAGNSVVQVIIWGTLTALVLFPLSYYQSIGNAYPLALAIGLLSVPVSILRSTLDSLATGLGQAKLLASTEMILRVSMAFLVGAFLLFGELKVWHLLAALLLATAATAAYSCHRIHCLIDGKWQVDKKLFWRGKNLILLAFGAGICVNLLQKVNVLLLGMWRPLAETGYYAIAQSLLDAIAILPGTLGFLLLPKIAQQESRSARNKLLVTVLIGGVAGFAIVCQLASLLAPWFIPFLFGQDFAAAVPVFQRLILAVILMAGFQICQGAVAGDGRALHVLIAPLVGLVAQLVVARVLIPTMGMLGAADASVIGYGSAFFVALFLALMKSEKQVVHA